MALLRFDGSVLTDGTEQTLFDVSTLKHYAADIFTHNMLAGDIVEIKVYKKDDNAAVMRVYRTRKIKNVQADPAFFIPFLPTSQYKVTIKRIAGTDRTYTWNRYET